MRPVLSGQTGTAGVYVPEGDFSQWAGPDPGGEVTLIPDLFYLGPESNQNCILYCIHA